jgi:hypothetical protein
VVGTALQGRRMLLVLVTVMCVILHLRLGSQIPEARGRAGLSNFEAEPKQGEEFVLLHPSPGPAVDEDG